MDGLEKVTVSWLLTLCKVGTRLVPAKSRRRAEAVLLAA